MKLKTGFPQLDNKESTWCPWKSCHGLSIPSLPCPRQYQEFLNHCYLNHPLFICRREISLCYFKTGDLTDANPCRPAGMVPVGRPQSLGDAPGAQLCMKSLPCFPPLPILSAGKNSRLTGTQGTFCRENRGQLIHWGNSGAES